MGSLCAKPVLDSKMRALCVRPYPGHPHGCPNFGNKEGCPGKVPLAREVFDLSRPTYFIYTRFDLGAHVERMKKRHPGWSQRQLVCCLYWQGTARKKLKRQIAAFLSWHKGMVVNTCPEALGINVTETMRRCGIELQWPPKTVVVHVAMAGWPK